MKIKLTGWLTGSVVVMILLPWAVVSFVKSNAGMAVTLLLFFIIDPIYSIAAGVFAGNNMKKLWGIPVSTAILFLVGAWIFFDMGEGAFVMYAGVYLIIGMAAMFVSSRISMGKQ